MTGPGTVVAGALLGLVLGVGLLLLARLRPWLGRRGLRAREDA